MYPQGDGGGEGTGSPPSIPLPNRPRSALPSRTTLRTRHVCCSTRVAPGSRGPRLEDIQYIDVQEKALAERPAPPHPAAFNAPTLPGQGRDGTSRDRGLPACRPPRPAGSRACRAPPRRVMLAYRDAAIRRERGHGSCSTADPLFTLIGGRGWDQHEPPTTHPRTPPVPVGAAGHSPWGTHCRLPSTRRAGGDAAGRQFLPQRCWH